MARIGSNCSFLAIVIALAAGGPGCGKETTEPDDSKCDDVEAAETCHCGDEPGQIICINGLPSCSCNPDDGADVTGDGDTGGDGDGDGDGVLSGDGDGDGVLSGDGDGDGGGNVPGKPGIYTKCAVNSDCDGDLTCVDLIGIGGLIDLGTTQCTMSCGQSADCPAATDGNASPTCFGGNCALDCEGGATCPMGKLCVDGDIDNETFYLCSA